MATPEQTLTPLTNAAFELRKHGVTLGYPAIWARCASASIPHVRIKNRVFLVGDMADIARIIQPHPRKAAA